MASKSRALNKNLSVLLQQEMGKRGKSVYYEGYDGRMTSADFIFFFLGDRYRIRYEG